MRVREAKDFLVRETAEQAELEGLPLSELEKRMMCFTEGPSAPEDRTQLNDDFEAEYDTEQFEAKISQLMRHARQRLKKEDPAKAAYWDNAVRCLEKGDHYILVLNGGSGSWMMGRWGRGEWRIALMIFLVAASAVLFVRILPRFLPAPHLSAIRMAQVLFLALLIATIFFPRLFNLPGKLVGRCLAWIAGIDEKQPKDGT
ncbi:MAG TPA: hypothetical protein VLW46_00345 [Candidatus Bathyarchaeia archaeon]|nr:hypothetical protein [Candidatus Bathyarchaeia archaeon]